MKITTISIDLAEMPRLKQVFPNLLRVAIEFTISYPRCGCEDDKIITIDKKIVSGELFSYHYPLKDVFKNLLVSLNTPRTSE